MRPIDGDALMDEANSDGAYGYVDAKQISEAPTIDAVPVVRCRECDHKTHDGNGRPYCLQLEMYLNKELDFFCSYGERRADT